MRKLSVGTGFGAIGAIFAVLLLLPVSSAGNLPPAVPMAQKSGALHEAAVSLPSSMVSRGTPRFGPVEMLAPFTGPTALLAVARPPGASARPVAAVTKATSPQLLSTVGGLNETGSGLFAEPSAQIATNGSYLFEVVSAEYRLTSTNGRTVYASGSLNSFWGLSASDLVAAPQIVYDALSRHWFVTADDYTTGVVWVAVSNTSSPSGAYLTFWYSAAIGTPAQYMDRPLLGVTKSYVAIDTNQYNSTTQALYGTDLVVFSKAKLLTGHLSDESFSWSSLFSMHPARDVVTNGSGTDYLYVAGTPSSVSFTSLDLYEFSGAVGSLRYHGYTFSIANTGLVPRATQAGTNLTLDTGDSRVASVSWSNAFLWVALTTACTPFGDGTVRSCVRVDAIDTTLMSLSQDTDTAVAGTYLFYGALTALRNGVGYLMVVGYSGALAYPSIAMTGQNTTDNYGTFRGPVPAFAGTTYESSGVFADWSGIQLAPAGGSKATAWGTAEYDTSLGWSTETIHFSFY